MFHQRLIVRSPAWATVAGWMIDERNMKIIRISLGHDGWCDLMSGV